MSEQPTPADRSMQKELGYPKLDPSLPTPLYHQMYLALREMIRRGDFVADEVLPSEHELAQAFNVSRITAQRALNDLAAHKLVSRHRGRGTVVARDARVPLIRGSYDSLNESIKQMGLRSDSALIETRKTKASKAVAQSLETPPGSPLQLFIWRRVIEGHPFSLVESHVPQDIASKFSRTNLMNVPLQVLLRRAGTKMLTAEQWISAVAAQPDVAPLLGVGIGYPLLRVDRILRDDTGRPVQLIYCHYRSDRFQWHINTEGAEIGGVVKSKKVRR